MKYRPEGWHTETIARDNLPTAKWGTEECEAVIKGIELGKDAMNDVILKIMDEALRKLGWRVSIQDEGAIRKSERDRILKYIEDNKEMAFGIPYISYKIIEVLMEEK